MSRVAEFNRAFQIASPAVPQLHIFGEDPEFAKQQVDLVVAEARELQGAGGTGSLREVSCALANLVYTAYSVGLSFGIDLDRAFQAVHDSNMSTLCNTAEEAELSARWHRSQVPKGGPVPPVAVRRADDGKRWVVHNEKTGEVLRSLAWHPADFAQDLSRLGA